MADFNILIVSPKKEGNTYKVASYLTTNRITEIRRISLKYAPAQHQKI